jgi:glycosyltransferase involved in cell wall biosynthesis
MSCERPLILGVDGHARHIVEDAEAGLVIEPENAQALADAIARLSRNRELGRTLGKKGRGYILKNFSRAQTAEKYIEVLRELAEEKSAEKN